MDPTPTTDGPAFDDASYAGDTTVGESECLEAAIGTLKHANHGLRRRLGGNEPDSGNAAAAAHSEPRTETVPGRAGSLDAQAWWRIALELEPAERLLWAGYPHQGWKFHTLDCLLIPLGIVGSAGAVAASIGVMAMVGGHVPAASAGRLGQEVNGLGRLLYALIAISATAASFYLSIGRLMVDARRRANTSYGLTPQRIIINSGWLRRNVTSLALDNLGHIMFSRHDDGSGTVRFGERSRLRPWHLPGLPVAAQPEFERIANVRRVLDQITRAQRGTLASPGSSSHRPASRSATRIARR
jgi:Bacterial PH domain